MLLLTIHYWVFNFEQLILSTKPKNMLDNRTIQFWIVKSPTQKIMPPDYKPKWNTSCAPHPQNLPQKIESPPQLLPKRSFIKQEKIESKKFNKESKQSKKQNKKVCNLYPFSWRNLCFKFFWVIFLLGVNVMRKQKQKQPYHVVCNNPKYPFYWWRLLWISFEIWITMNFSFYHQWFSFYSFTFKDKNLYSIFRYILYVCE